MKVSLELISIEQKKFLGEMLKAYERELTGEEDPGEYKYLDSYWRKEDRKPYFITINDDVAGFALLNKHTVVQNNGYNIAEFYVKKEYRNKGVAKKAAYQLFSLFPGKWEVRQLSNNSKARTFWNKVIKEYTSDHYKEKLLNNDKWRGYIQTFEKND